MLKRYEHFEIDLTRSIAPIEQYYYDDLMSVSYRKAGSIVLVMARIKKEYHGEYKSIGKEHLTRWHAIAITENVESRELAALPCPPFCDDKLEIIDFASF